MGKIEAVILDWAGTTVDFGCIAPLQAFMDAFQSVGILPEGPEVRKPMGMRKRDHVRAMLSMERINGLWMELYKRPWSEADVDVIYQKSEEGILTILEGFSNPKPHVLQTVASLRSKGIKIGSTTGYTDEMMEIVTAGAKAGGYEPDVWFSPDSVENVGRPYPFMVFKNLEALKVSGVGAAVKVGDTVADILEGKNAGVISVGVVEGSSVMGLSEEEFNLLTKEEYRRFYREAAKTYREAGADYVLSGIEELPGLIELLEREE